MSHQVSTNVRYLLWRRGTPREQWEAWLSARTSLSSSLSRLVVSGQMLDEQVTSDALRSLARVFDCADDGESIRLDDLVGEATNILVENLRYLFKDLGRGGKKQLAAELSIDPTTVSRWLSGAFEPQGPSLRQLVAYFGLPPDTDLRKTPIFLSVEPVAAIDRKRWLHARIDALSPDEFRELYPALRRMLGEQ
jgi:transcriptional regulator with XRE-family HTH domain